MPLSLRVCWRVCLLQMPRLRLNPAVTDLFAFRYEDFELLDYDAHPHIAAHVAV